MEWYIVLAIGFVFMFAMMFVGLPVSFSFLTAGTFVIFLLEGFSGLAALSKVSFESVNSFTLLCIPLFVFMAHILGHSGISEDIYSAARAWLYRLPAGLGMTNAVASAVLGACCGSATAAAATMGEISIPQLTKFKYRPELSVGSVAAGATLSILIPPSTIMVIYSVMTEVSLGHLFMAGFIPGIVLTLIFCVYMLIRTLINPAMAPKVELTISWKERLRATSKIWAPLVLIGAVLATIYLGVCTPTEAAASGAFCALIIWVAAYRDRVNRKNFQEILYHTLYTTGFIMFIVIGAHILAHFVVLSGLTFKLTDFVLGLGVNKWLVLVVIGGIYFVMGVSMDIIGLLTITLPIFFPLVITLGFDPVWFGIFTVINMEMALLTPPVGFDSFVIAGIARRFGIDMGEVFKAIWPFVGLMVLSLVIFSIFPEIVLWLPGTMG